MINTNTEHYIGDDNVYDNVDIDNDNNKVIIIIVITIMPNYNW